ncbi:AAA domain-containing protein [bacterium]|nr:AAA domain-containing protein [bacterium]
MNMSTEHVKSFGSLVGQSKRMQKIHATIEKFAAVEYPVMIVGETGTGKELVARELHDRSLRKDKPFVAVNMSAIPSELIASELFGHEKGSFTGAVSQQKGRFEEAEGGTLFLDEVITMDDKVQVALLRVLETGKFRRVGGTKDLETNVRVISSSNQNPYHAVRANRFRIDLLHRLQVVRITIPPLRKRKRDIPLLVKHFLMNVNEAYQHINTSVSTDAMQVLKEYTWPGNVRELRNVVIQAAAGANNQTILPEHLPIYSAGYAEDEELLDGQEEQASLPSNIQTPDMPASDMPANMPSPNMPISTGNVAGAEGGNIFNTAPEGMFIPVGLSLNEVEKAYILKTLSLNGNNKTKAAKILGLSRKTLYDKLCKWDLLEK